MNIDTHVYMSLGRSARVVLLMYLRLQRCLRLQTDAAVPRPRYATTWRQPAACSGKSVMRVQAWTDGWRQVCTANTARPGSCCNIGLVRERNLAEGEQPEPDARRADCKDVTLASAQHRPGPAWRSVRHLLNNRHKSDVCFRRHCGLACYTQCIYIAKYTYRQCTSTTDGMWESSL
jgi:hypothetical protein